MVHQMAQEGALWPSVTVYHESFEAKNLRGQCITQKKLSRIPIVIAISARFSIATEIFHGKKFRGATKNRENRETFLPRNFHGIRYDNTWAILVQSKIKLG